MARSHGAAHVQPGMFLAQEMAPRSDGMDHIDGQAFRGDFHVKQGVASPVVKVVVVDNGLGDQQSICVSQSDSSDEFRSRQANQERVQRNFSGSLPAIYLGAVCTESAAESRDAPMVRHFDRGIAGARISADSQRRRLSADRPRHA